MIMNSNVVYGSAMPCHTSGLVTAAGPPVPGSEYSAHHHHHPHHHHAHHHQGYFNPPDISSYYQTATAVANSVAVPPASLTASSSGGGGSSSSPPTSDHQLASLNAPGGGGQQAQPHATSSTPPSSQHYATGFHMSASGHPFADLSSHVAPPPSLGIISESNGLSYTNLDINNQNGGVGYNAHQHYQRLGQYGPSGSIPTSHPSSQCNNNASSPQLSSGSSSASSGSSTTAVTGNSLYPFNKCDSYDPSPPSPPSSGPNSGGSASLKCEPHDMLTSLGDCGLGGRGPNGYASYFDSSNLLPSRSSRNATPLGQHHPMQHLSNGLVNGGSGNTSPYGLDVGGLGVNPYVDMSCGPLNGNAYHPHHVSAAPHPHHHLGGGHHHHLNHLQSSQQHQQQHASPNSRGNLNNANSGSLLTSAAPVTQYKWMQVKRNIPKPGKCLVVSKELFSRSHHLSDMCAYRTVSSAFYPLGPLDQFVLCPSLSLSLIVSSFALCPPLWP